MDLGVNADATGASNEKLTVSTIERVAGACDGERQRTEELDCHVPVLQRLLSGSLMENCGTRPSGLKF